MLIRVVNHFLQYNKKEESLLAGIKYLNNVISQIKNNKLKNHVRFQLFGCDLAADDDLKATLIEINKGPDLDAKDEKDKKIKLKVQEDILQLIDPIPEDDIRKNRFIKLKTI